MTDTVDRRSFMLGGLALAGATNRAGGTQVHADAVDPLPALPWPYAPLDVPHTRRLGHLMFGRHHCCEGVFATLVTSLAERVGTPYDRIPLGMMAYGNSGVAGYGSLCGALNGAGAAMSLACPKPVAKQLLAALINWYAVTPLPTEASNVYAQEHDYLPGDSYTVDIALPQSVAKGNLCHLSVSNWCGVSRFASGSPQRSERCGRLTGDVAAKAAELMNTWHAGMEIAPGATPAAASGCMSCHDISDSSYTRGKMDCRICHTDAVKPSAMHYGRIASFEEDAF